MDLFLSDRTHTFKTIQKIIQSNFEDSIDVVALSSTHLPFIKKLFDGTFTFDKIYRFLCACCKGGKNHLQFNKDINKNGTGKLEILVSSNKKDFQDYTSGTWARGKSIYDVSCSFKLVNVIKLL